MSRSLSVFRFALAEVAIVLIFASPGLLPPFLRSTATPVNGSQAELEEQGSPSNAACGGPMQVGGAGVQALMSVWLRQTATRKVQFPLHTPSASHAAPSTQSTFVFPANVPLSTSNSA